MKSILPTAVRSRKPLEIGKPDDFAQSSLERTRLTTNHLATIAGVVNRFKAYPFKPGEASNRRRNIQLATG